VSDLLFTVSHKHVEQYRSPVYDRVKKGDISILMVLSQPVIVCGDVMIEFFNKPKMLSKVRLLSLISLNLFRVVSLISTFVALAARMRYLRYFVVHCISNFMYKLMLMLMMMTVTMTITSAKDIFMLFVSLRYLNKLPSDFDIFSKECLCARLIN